MGHSDSSGTLCLFINKAAMHQMFLSVDTVLSGVKYIEIKDNTFNTAREKGSFREYQSTPKEGCCRGLSREVESGNYFKVE